MNERIRDMWADALESDEFKQAVGAMRRTEIDCITHCCLGVLCELHCRETGNGDWVAHTKALPEFPGINFSYGGYSTMLPIEVCDWAGLAPDEANPVLSKEGLPHEWVHAVTANDNLGWSFKQIAEAIRKNL